jgi:hypothetical protein
VWSVAFFMNGEMYMLFEQVYVLFIYILIGKLAMVTVVAIALFVALVVTIRRLDNKKTHLCLVIEMYSIIIKLLGLSYKHLF